MSGIVDDEAVIWYRHQTCAETEETTHLQHREAQLLLVPVGDYVIDDNGQKITLPGASKDELKKLSEFNYPAS